MTQNALSQAFSELRDEYANQNPKSLLAFEDATRYLPGGGTRSSIFVDPFPLTIAKGYETTLVDVDGHEYLDFVSDFTSGIYGKTNTLIRESIIQALDRGLQLGAHTSSENKLAQLICSRFPAMDQIRFANSGTEANMLAISTAIRYTSKSTIVVFEGGYHGSLLCHFHLDQKPSDDKTALSAPYDIIVCPYNDLEGTRERVKAIGTNLAAILVEPMLGAGGCIPGSPDFLHGLRTLADEHEALLIFDEVQTARLAVGGRQQLLGIEPDITTLGKFFGGGLAFGAFGGKKEIMSLFDMRRPGAVSHGGTFNNSPLTMAAGVTAVEQLLTPEALEALNVLGDEMRTRLNDSLELYKAPFKITGLGSLNQIHCTLSDHLLAKQGLEYLYFALLRKGIWIAQRGLISLSFAMTKEDVERFCKTLEQLAKQVGDLLNGEDVHV